MKKSLFLVIKACITVICLFFIFNELKGVEWGAVRLSLYDLSVIAVVLLLMPVNWWLEACRWKLSLPMEQLTLKTALISVLSGLALNWVMPFTSGDVLGRLSNVRNLKQSAQSLIWNRVIISVITLLFGGISVLWFCDLFQNGYWWLLPAIGFLLIGAMALLGLRKQWLSITCLTLLRYLIFIVQFWLVLAIYLPIDAYLIILGIGWVYLFRTFVPSLFGNFGVREASAMLFFQQYIDDMSLVLIPCLIIWTINTVIPSIIGTMFIFDLKLKLAQ